MPLPRNASKIWNDIRAELPLSGYRGLTQEDAVPRCHPISAMIGFRKTPKVKPSTGPLHTTRPPTAPTTTHHGLVKLSRMLFLPRRRHSRIAVSCGRPGVQSGLLTGPLPLFGSPAYRALPPAVFSRNIVIKPCTCPPLCWMTEANSERWVTAMLMPSTETSLIL
jgi:hypothetical protein